MKTFCTSLLVLVACLCLIQSAEAWNRPSIHDRFNCFAKNRDVGNAIETFCFKNNNMVVPSQKARDGAWSKKGKISVWIRGNCKPPQWVPSSWCFDNFFNMCMNMNKNNKVTANYGKDGGCQTWRIKQF